MQMLLNCHLATFLNLNRLYKKWPNNNLITCACSSLLLATYVAIYNVKKTVSPWPPLDITSCSYQMF